MRWSFFVVLFALGCGAGACGDDGAERAQDSDAAVQAASEAGLEESDASASTDAGAEPRDAGKAPLDASSDPRDAGSTARDASPQERDASMQGASDAQVDAAAPTTIASARVFFFGHSLVDQDMPAMLGSLATARKKTYSAAGQLGWGTQLRDHFDWNGDFNDPPLGFAEENQGRAFFVGEGKAQLRTGRYDVMVLTESNGHTRGDGNETVDYAARLIEIARQANPAIRVYLYGNWLDRTELANEDAWRSKTEADVVWWESVADRINARIDGPDIFVIPGGVLLARVTREAAQGKLAGLTVDGLFREGDGVHVNDRGFYVIALAHYAAIFRDTPVGLPAATSVENGPAQAHSAQNATRLQQLVWDYLKAYPRAGIPQ